MDLGKHLYLGPTPKLVGKSGLSPRTVLPQHTVGYTSGPSYISPQAPHNKPIDPANILVGLGTNISASGSPKTNVTHDAGVTILGPLLTFEEVGDSQGSVPFFFVPTPGIDEIPTIDVLPTGINHVKLNTGLEFVKNSVNGDPSLVVLAEGAWPGPYPGNPFVLPALDVPTGYTFVYIITYSRSTLGAFAWTDAVHITSFGDNEGADITTTCAIVQGPTNGPVAPAFQHQWQLDGRSLAYCVIAVPGT